MNRSLTALLVFLILLPACSGSPGETGFAGSTDPITPQYAPSVCMEQSEASSFTHLWGFYAIYIDVESGTVEAAYDRTAMFTANVTVFLNGKPPGIAFAIHKIIPESEYTDIDIDVILTHPFPGLYQYNGYDVRGIFMGNGSASLEYNEKLFYPVSGLDQFMFENPDPFGGGNGAPDGYSRWFNSAEFSEGGMPLFSYTPGDFASAGFDGTATLCPYRYFADGLGANDNLFDFLVDTDNHGVFEAGATNRRNYYLRFPSSTSVNYGYAVIANWENVDVHPSHANEAQALRVTDSSTVYYVDETNNGGKLVLDIEAFGWETSTGGPADWDIIIESTVTSAPQTFDGNDIGVPGGDNLSTYHIEIPADDITGTEDNEFWVILETECCDYTNDFGTPNLADTDPLAAFFRYDLFVSPIATNTPPEVTGIEDVEGSGIYENPVNIKDEKNYWAIFNDPDPAQTHSFTWYVVDDGAGPPGPADEVTLPVHWGAYGKGEYDIYVDVDDGIDSTLGGPFDITVNLAGGVITFGGPSSEYMQDFHLDSGGGMYSCGYFFGEINLDPDGNDPHYQVGGGNMWVNKLNSDGSFAWGYSWPSLNGYHSYVWAVDIDSDDNIYFVGSFHGTCDFDPGDGVDMHTASNGGNNSDAFIMKFNSDGEYQWGYNWGGTQTMNARDVVLYDDSHLYITGYFFHTCDLDPTAGVDNHTASGIGNGTNGYLIRIDKNLSSYDWGYDWGSGGVIYSYHVAADSSGNALITGTTEYTVDLDPTAGNQSYTSSGWGDSFVTKFGPDGTWYWAFGFGGIYWDLTNGIAVDSSGYVYAIGGFSSPTVDFDPDPIDEWPITKQGTGAYNYDGFMTKYDPDGDFIWVKIFATPDHDNIWAIMFDESDDIIMAGHTRGTLDLDPGPGVDEYMSHGENDAYTVKMNSDGEYIWGSGWGGSSWDNPDAIDIDSDGLIYVAGKFSETVDFDPSDSGVDERTSNGSYDEFIQMLIPETGEW